MANVRKVSSGEDVDGTLLVVGLAAFSDGRWHAWAIPSLIGAAVTFVALGFFTARASWLLGNGGWERPILLSPGIWVFAAGVRFLRLHPKVTPTVAAPVASPSASSPHN